MLVFCQISCFLETHLAPNPNRNDITGDTELGTCYESKGSHSKTFWIYFTLRMVFQVFICSILIQYPLLTLWGHFFGKFFGHLVLFLELSLFSKWLEWVASFKCLQYLGCIILAVDYPGLQTTRESFFFKN